MIFYDGSYFIGQFKNNLRNGKGIEYYKNGNIFYDGDFIDNKREGNGKYINEDGEIICRSISEWIKKWKGKIYLKNGIIFYDGIFINNKSALDSIIN